MFTYAPVELLLLKGKKFSLSVAVLQTVMFIVRLLCNSWQSSHTIRLKHFKLLGVLRFGVSTNSCDVKPDRKVLLK